VVCGYGDVGKGCASRCAARAPAVIVTEIDPICALQAAMDGYQVASPRGRPRDRGLFITATGCFDVITAEQMARMKHQAIVGNIGTSTTRSTSPASPSCPASSG
jgi:adenosylhomocysteinase